MTPTANERRAARRLDRDRGELEQIGQSAAQRIGRQVRLAALRALRDGRSITEAMTDALDPLRRLMIDGMVAGHLQGRHRSLRTYARHTSQRVTFATDAYKGALEFLRQQMEITPASLDLLRQQYDPQVTDLLAALREQLSDRVGNVVMQITREQLHVRAGSKLLKQAFDKAGITPDNSYTIENLFRTQTQLSYSAGRWQVLQQPELDEVLWGYVYVTVGDGRVRPNHAAMDGTRLPKAHPFWQANFPPNGYSCRCAALEVWTDDSTARPDRIREPQPLQIDGAVIQPEADRGFAFNPGRAVAAAVS